LFFQRRSRRGAPPISRSSEGGPPQEDDAPLYLIDFDMMLKGSVYKRRNGAIRQYGVTVNGSTRLVTSGDTVDRDTYRALLVAGAIRPVAVEPLDPPAKGSAVVDYTTVETPEDEG